MVEPEKSAVNAEADQREFRVARVNRGKRPVQREAGLVRDESGDRHPEVVGIGACFGHWSRGEPLCRGKGIHFNSLIPHKMGWIDAMSGHIDACAPVKVRKA